ncbi:MAG: hypothetical protein ABWU84_01615 [Pyrobaculum sp.]|uniref:hypothetical protein n=1 Tax=Pyrobaculum sp. TaxID=2004705 RepID=UPI003EEA114F
MDCAEREHIPVTKERLGCSEPSDLDLGFMKVRPDLICGGVPTEVECASRVHLGIGQALAYKYAWGTATLVVIVRDASQSLRQFLEWAMQALGLRIYIYTGEVITPLNVRKPPSSLRT